MKRYRSLTQSDRSPPSIDALRKDHSITSSAIASGARTRLRCGAILGALSQAGPLSFASLPLLVKHAACLAIVIGILAQSGGFFVRLIPKWAALGIKLTLSCAVILVCAIVVLIYGLITAA
jgi:hypothetical protein